MNKLRSGNGPFALFAGAGCLVQVLFSAILAWLSVHAISAVLFWGFGRDAQASWDSVNIVVRVVVAFLASAIAIPAWIIAFILQLAIPTPFF